MPPRRRITSVIEQQHRLRELGRIRWGARKLPDRPGPPLQFPRFSSSNEDAVSAVAEHYGGEVTVWDRDGAHEWDVTTTQPIAIGVPPGIPFTSSAFEQWANGFLTVRCEGDGGACQFRQNGRWVERPCVCQARGLDFKERDCKQTSRFSVMVLGIPILGVWRMDTKGYNASAELPFTLALLQQERKAAYMQARQRSDRVLVWNQKKGEDVPTGRRYWVIEVDAPFLPDEVTYLDRPASMAALPAPATPALPRGVRPQLGAGSSIDPVGPQVIDRPPPPREVAPVDLDDAEFEDVGEGEGDQAPAEPVEAAAPAEDAEWLAAREKLEQRASAADVPTLPGTEVPTTGTDPDAPA